MLSHSTLTINVQNIIKNYNIIKETVGNDVTVAAVVKANCYGLGIAGIAPHLTMCKEMFVATLDEGLTLRRLRPDAEIYVLSGVNNGEEQYFVEHKLIPVLNLKQHLITWLDASKALGMKLKAIIQIDTGMTRAGFEYDTYQQILSLIQDLEICYIMSHLACPDIHNHPMNITQLQKFNEIKTLYPQFKYSFASSAGIFLGKDYAFDQVRPGVFLYGCDAGSNNNKVKAHPVVSLKSKIAQTYHVNEDSTIGYGATYKLKGGMITATIPVGYADGYSRTLSNKGYCYIQDIKVPIIGRISMDMLSLDVTHVPEGLRQRGQEVELIGKNISVETVAELANTIGYEILTALGNRYNRQYII